MNRWVLAAARRWLGLPARRCRVFDERASVPLPDGTRLATQHLWPIGIGDAPVVLIRTPYAIDHFPGTTRVMGHLIAEHGYHVVLQDVRGRYASEGRFTPFANEADDGAATLRWIAERPWSRGRTALIGASYSGYAAWAALGDAPELVSALVVIIGTRDLYASFYPGGAFSLANALEWITHVGEREDVPPSAVDLERGLRHRPVREADRVARRRSDAFREWIDHPRRDAFWDALLPPLPRPLPPALFVAGWYDFFLGPQLDDHAALVEAAAEQAGPPPQLLIGPWSHGGMAHRDWQGGRLRQPNGMGAVAMRETLRFLDRHVRGDASPAEPAGVRYFDLGASAWKSATAWPPDGFADDALYLRGRAPEAEGGGLCERHPDAAAAPSGFRVDPSDPTPTLGGALFGGAGGAFDQSSLDGRSDVLQFTSEPLTREREVVGRIRAVLYVSSSADDADFCAKLIDVSAEGRTRNVCEGVARARWRDARADEKQARWLERGLATRLTVDLWASAWTFRVGHRLRLAISATSFPRFDRNPNGRDDPGHAEPDRFERAEQWIHHDHERPSHVMLPTRQASNGGS